MDEEKKMHKNKHVKWDQEQLKETEKYRGTFEKISEPKTPYHGNSEEEDNEMEEQIKSEEEKQVEASLRQAQINRDTNKKGRINLSDLNAKLKEEMAKYKDNSGGEMEEEETEEQKKKREEFKKKRAAHYNEFQKIQQAKFKLESDEDD